MNKCLFTLNCAATLSQILAYVATNFGIRSEGTTRIYKLCYMVSQLQNRVPCYFFPQFPTLFLYNYVLIAMTSSFLEVPDKLRN